MKALSVFLTTDGATILRRIYTTIHDPNNVNAYKSGSCHLVSSNTIRKRHNPYDKLILLGYPERDIVAHSIVIDEYGNIVGDDLQDPRLAHEFIDFDEKTGIYRYRLFDVDHVLKMVKSVPARELLSIKGLHQKPTKSKSSELSMGKLTIDLRPDCKGKLKQLMERRGETKKEFNEKIEPTLQMILSATPASEWKKIEKNPRKWAEGVTVTELVRAIKEASNLYYNQGTSPISDKAFDIIEGVLRERKPNHKYFSDLGAEVTVGKKVRLPYNMPSLDKKRPDKGNLQQWLDENPGPYVASDKLDGNSIEIIYKKDGTINIYRKGKADGGYHVGQDISAKAKYLKLPKLKADLAIRAELIIPKKAFSNLIKLSKDPDSFNLRNYVAGLANRKENSKELAYAKVVCYEILNQTNLKLSQQLKKLKQLGFDVVAHKVYQKLDVEKLNKLLEMRKKSSPYDVDGIVVFQDKPYRRPASGNPKYAFAFKSTLEEDTKTLKVKEVIWTASKHGKLIPVVVTPRTKLGGVLVTKYSGHNAFFIEHGYRLKDRKLGLPKRSIGPGAVIKVTRSGDVIPHIIEVVKGAKAPQFPKTPYEWDAQRVNIISKETSQLVKNKRLVSFFKTLGIENISLGRIDQLVKAGYDTVPKLIKAKPYDFIKIEGIQKKMADKLYQSIHSKLENVPLHKLMAASGVFGAGIAVKKLLPLVTKYPDILDMANDRNLVTKLRRVEGFQLKTAQQFADKLPEFIMFLRATRLKPMLPQKVRPISTKLKGQSVLFTGFRDAALEETIVKNGGTIASGISKTTILLAKDPHGSSSKLQQARDKGIVILTADQFRRKYKL